MVTLNKVSIIMPAYNSEKYISAAIESVLNQTYKDFELIIIDDASTDSTYNIISSYMNQDSRIKVIKNSKNLNIGESLNKGVAAATSDLIARMDSDDICFENRIELQVKYLLANPHIAVVGSDILLIDEQGNDIHTRAYYYTDNDIKKRMLRYSPFAHPSVMYRKKVFMEFSGYDSSKSPSEDIDLWFRIGTKHSFANIERPLIKYRYFHKSSSNRNLRRLEINTIKMRYQAIKKFGYRPSVIDLVYNLGQLATIYITPPKLRMWLFNYLRKEKLI